MGKSLPPTVFTLMQEKQSKGEKEYKNVHITVSYERQHPTGMDRIIGALHVLIRKTGSNLSYTITYIHSNKISTVQFGI